MQTLGYAPEKTLQMSDPRTADVIEHYHDYVQNGRRELDKVELHIVPVSRVSMKIPFTENFTHNCRR
jgi:hypothetical protein